jgi:hypothetical protein
MLPGLADLPKPQLDNAVCEGAHHQLRVLPQSTTEPVLPTMNVMHYRHERIALFQMILLSFHRAYEGDMRNLLRSSQRVYWLNNCVLWELVY